MKHAASLRLVSLALVLVTGACSQDRTSYPSLGSRPIEKLGFAEPEVKTVVAAPDPALDGEIAAISGKLDAIASGFAGTAAKAETLARAARGAVGSDAWITAQTALAGLDDWRAQSSALVTDIEALATDRAAQLQPDYPALATIRAQAQAETDRQTATIGRIQASMPAA